MSVLIQWTERAAGRHPGDQEEVELTPFVQGCLDQGRAFIVQAPIVGFSEQKHTFPEPAVEAPAPALTAVVVPDEKPDVPSGN